MKMHINLLSKIKSTRYYARLSVCAMHNPQSTHTQKQYYFAVLVFGVWCSAIFSSVRERESVCAVCARIVLCFDARGTTERDKSLHLMPRTILTIRNAMQCDVFAERPTN